MKITLHADGSTYRAELPYDGAAYVTVQGFTQCPLCARKLELLPFGRTREALKVAGRGNHIESHDTYAAEAFALCCGKRIGTLRVTVSTIFGIEEDERVLNSRARVY